MCPSGIDFSSDYTTSGENINIYREDDMSHDFLREFRFI